jgi:hypothetical protein
MTAAIRVKKRNLCMGGPEVSLPAKILLKNKKLEGTARS